MELYERVVTAGVYVALDGEILFVTGPTPAGDRIGVVRVGGHRNPGETPWECARRELLEETGLQANPVRPRGTWLVRWEGEEPLLEPFPWPESAKDDVPPILIIPRMSGPHDGPVTVMYLVQAGGAPQPLDVKAGLLLLRPELVRRVVREPMTLRDCLDAGGRALLKAPVNESLPLLLGIQIRLLDRLLEMGAITA